MRVVSRTSVFAITLSAIAALSLYAQAKPYTGKLISSLSGTWKEDESKRKLGSAPGLRFRATTNGAMEELRGPESKPMVQPVKFDGKTYPMDSGNSLSWKQIDANNFERRTFQNGKLLSVRRIRISADGKTLHEESDRTSLAGKTQGITTEYRRSGGNDKGLAGTWQRLSIKQTVPAEVTYTPAGQNAVKVDNRMGGSHTLDFDGKSSPITGESVIPGMSITAKIIDSNSIETTTLREGVLAGKARMVLSDGGKVMTVTTTGAGPESSREPNVTVFNKQ